MTTKFKNERYVEQRKNKNGTWSFRVRYKSATKTFSEEDYLSASQAYKEAVSFKNELMFNKNISVIKKSNKMLSELLEESFDLYPLRAESKRKLRSIFKNYIKDCTIDKVNNIYIIQSLNAMIEIATDDTIKRAESTWKRIIKYALIKEYIDKDPMVNVTRPASHLISCFTVKKDLDRETLVLVENLCGNRLRSAHEREQIPLLLEMLYLTGMRPGEAIALLKSDCTDGYISITKEVGSSLNESHVVRKCKTEQSVRKIPMTDEMKTVVARLSSLSENDLLIPFKDGGYYDTTDLGNRLHLLTKKHLGISFNMYQIRHLFSTRLLRAGVDVKTIQCLMGHSNMAMTISYATTNDEEMLKALK